LKPAVERAERLRAEAAPPGGGADGRRPLGVRRTPAAEGTGPPGEPGSPEHRGACVGAYMSVQGLSRERAEAQYERQLAEYRATGGE
jgi:hypothetical protein